RKPRRPIRPRHNGDVERGSRRRACRWLRDLPGADASDRNPVALPGPAASGEAATPRRDDPALAGRCAMSPSQERLTRSSSRIDPAVAGLVVSVLADRPVVAQVIRLQAGASSIYGASGGTVQIDDGVWNIGFGSGSVDGQLAATFLVRRREATRTLSFGDD